MCRLLGGGEQAHSDSPKKRATLPIDEGKDAKADFSGLGAHASANIFDEVELERQEFLSHLPDAPEEAPFSMTVMGGRWTKLRKGNFE